MPSSTCRDMFSSTTIASSTTKPVATVSAINDRLSRVYPSRYMAAKVPAMETGTATAGISVARALRRNRKTTPVTRPTATSKRHFGVVQTGADRNRAVHGGEQVDVPRHGRQQMRDRRLHAVHGIDDVGAGLAKHDRQNRRLALRNPGVSEVFDRIQDVCHVGQPHGGIVAISDHKWLVICRAGRLVIGIKLIMQRILCR